MIKKHVRQGYFTHICSMFNKIYKWKMYFTHIYIYIQSKCQSMKERKTISSLHTSELCWRHIPWGKSSWIESEEKLSRLVGEIFVNEQKGQYFIQPAIIRYGKY
jgi:hypothetical protein